MSIFDVAVVGGGPAGSSVAAALAKQGLSVALLEQAQSQKPCGGFLPIKALRRIPTGVVTDLLGSPVKTVCLQTQQPHGLLVSSHQPLGYVLPRRQLDQCLLEHAEYQGVTVRRGCRVTACERRGPRIFLASTQGTLQADYLIGADGVHSGVAVKAGVRRRYARWQLAFSQVAELHWRDPNSRLPSDQIRLVCLPVFGGFGWIFPLPEGANVGVAGSSLDLARIQSSFARLLASVASDFGAYDIVWQRGWWLPAGGIPRPIAAERTLLVGDAAGFVDCFIGEGIYYAIVSGQLAAHAISSAFSDPVQVAKHYQRDCGTLLMPTLRRSLLLGALMGRHKQRYYLALRRHPELATHLHALMLGERPYHGIVLALLAAFLRSWFDTDRAGESQEVFGVEHLNS